MCVCVCLRVCFMCDVCCIEIPEHRVPNKKKRKIVK